MASPLPFSLAPAQEPCFARPQLQPSEQQEAEHVAATKQCIKLLEKRQPPQWSGEVRQHASRLWKSGRSQRKFGCNVTSSLPPAHQLRSAGARPRGETIFQAAERTVAQQLRAPPPVPVGRVSSRQRLSFMQSKRAFA